MTGNKTIDMAVLGLATLITLGVTGIFVQTEMLYERPLPSEEIEKAELIEDSKEKAFVDVFKLDKMIINLRSRKSRLRFLDIEIHLRPFKSDDADLFEKNKAFIHDSIIDIAGHMEPEELNSLYGKTLLEDRIKKRVNGHFPKAILRDIYFSRFVVQ